ncbi:hypothetical protein NUW54_g10151 [Trametes sanguinea]|uniref:Uncharacterized protein n=1 Tax=Trametes sanguinea TaxID=158606 RepID=A0ACC1P457_9APHY|nr:hypothetical protein NUW54_g10151 [Trametes sanguinea]
MSSNNPLAEDRQPTHQDDIEVLVLPEPGQVIDRVERKVKVLRVKITKDLRVKDLKELLKAYGLPLSGKRDILVQRLRKYAEDPEQWNSQFMPARNHERGDISSRRAANSHAARRIISQFGTKESKTEYASRKQGMEAFAVEPPPTDAVREANSEWVKMVLKRRTIIQNPSTTGSAQQHANTAVTQGARDEQTIAQGSGSFSGLVVNASSELDGEAAGRARVGVGPEFPVVQHEKASGGLSDGWWTLIAA